MNKNTLINFVMFATGAAIGSVVTWKLLKTKYELIAQEEIESVKEEYERFFGDCDDEDIEEDMDEEEEHTSEVPESLAQAYAQVVNHTGYAGEEKVEVKGETDVDRPYVIAPEEYDELGYRTITLYCYEDGVITDVNDNIIENAEEFIGKDIDRHFGEYEDDSVFVRNDALKCDYEILRDYDNYRDKHPESMED